MAGDERVGPTEAPDQGGAPRGLWVWIGIQILGFVVAPLLDPGPDRPWGVWAYWAVVVVLLAIGLLRGVKLAWGIAILSEAWMLLAGLTFFVELFRGREDLDWYLWGLVSSGGSLWALLSPGMRRWMNEASRRDAVASSDAVA